MEMLEMLETKQALRPQLNKPQLPKLFFALKNASVDTLSNVW